jgi:tRNA U34 2-thiouridine synthase MnmA/TrmU
LAEDKELANKIERLKVRQAKTQARLEKSGGDTQVSETDPQARLLSKRGQTVAGYNVQIAVDSKNKLIVCNEVVNEGNDSQQLAAMAIKAKETLGVEHLEVDADSGYDNREQIKTCLEAGITP